MITITKNFIPYPIRRLKYAFYVVALESGNLTIFNTWNGTITAKGTNIPAATTATIPVEENEVIIIDAHSASTLAAWTSRAYTTTVEPFLKGVPVYIDYMPEMKYFGTYSNGSLSLPDWAFAYFNYGGSLQYFSDVEGMMDTSEVTSMAYSGFTRFAGGISKLPENSFNFDRLTSCGSNCFDGMFLGSSNIQSLPDGSFSFMRLSTAGNALFNSFNQGGSLKSLPDGSFRLNTLRSTQFNLLSNFNSSGSLEHLPNGSFNLTGLNSIGFYFATSFNANGKLKDLPDGAFTFSSTMLIPRDSLTAFNMNGDIEILPKGSFNIKLQRGQIRTTNVMANFNYGGKIPKDETNHISAVNINSAAITAHYYGGEDESVDVDGTYYWKCKA